MADSDRYGEAFIAVDWGTTNRRAYRIEHGQVTARERDACGVASMARDAYPAELSAIRARLGDLPVLIAGMAGSSIGWRETPYVPAPTGLAAIAHGLGRIDARTAIVPGLSCMADGRADVMRGEEVQLLGACAAGLATPDALIVQPGTHCKWAWMADGGIERFVTAMTGELFALLRSGSILAHQFAAPVSAGPAFLEGVAEGARGDLAARLFGIRAAVLLGRRDERDAASFASGLLIGAEVAARLDESGHAAIHLAADATLGPLYAAAIEAQGREVRLIDSEAAFVAGMIHLGRLIA